MSGHITYYAELEQGTEEWLEARCGMLTASAMKLILTPTLKQSSSKDERAHLYELAAQRVTQYVEPSYQSWDMEQGHVAEIEARRYYSATYAPVTEMGFIVNRRHGFPLGYSPDGLVGEDGLWECKRRLAKYQIQTIVENVDPEVCPPDFLLQCQTGLLVSERKWLDLTTFCGGMPMTVIRVWPDDKVQAAILEAATAAEARIAKIVERYREVLDSPARLVPTQRILFTEVL